MGFFRLFIVSALWQMHDVPKAQAHTRQQRAQEEAQAAAASSPQDSEKS